MYDHGEAGSSPCGSEDKGENAVWLSRKPLQYWQRESGSLAAASVRGSEDVPPLQDGRYAAALHLCRLHHAQRFAHPAPTHQPLSFRYLIQTTTG